MATTITRGVRRVLIAGLATLALLGCTSATPTGTPGVPPTLPPPEGSIASTLRIGIASEPLGFLLPADDLATQLVDRFLHAALYRLDPSLAPQPNLATALPAVSKDRLTWTLALDAARQFSDGSAVRSADVVRTFQLVLSPACPFGARCAIATSALSSVTAIDATHVAFRLRRPWAPVLADLLAQLPILPASALDASLKRLLDGAVGLDAAHVSALTDRIEASTNADACNTEASPPPTCHLASYLPDLRTMFARAALPLPESERYVDPNGQPDPEAYASVLLGRLERFGSALAASGTDRLAAALPLLDLAAKPIGAGPFRLVHYEPRAGLDLARWAPAVPGAPAFVRIRIFSDAAAAATALQAGDVDWLPDVQPDLVAGLATTSGLRVAARPSTTLQMLVFNVRPGHPYQDRVTRDAFVMCLDRHADLSEATRGRGLPADTPLPPRSWAVESALPWPTTDVAGATLALEQAGWARGADGVYAKAGVRLATTIWVRPGRSDVLALATAAATRLRTCGISLTVQAAPLSGRSLLEQVEYPNRFDTFLASQTAGIDPDDDLGRLHSRRVTTAAKPGDANFGGWQDKTTDGLLDTAAGRTDPAGRAAVYRQLQGYLALAAPIVPLFWEPDYAGVGPRLTVRGTPVDPSVRGYEQDLLEWRLSGP